MTETQCEWCGRKYGPTTADTFETTGYGAHVISRRFSVTFLFANVEVHLCSDDIDQAITEAINTYVSVRGHEDFTNKHIVAQSVLTGQGGIYTIVPKVSVEYTHEIKAPFTNQEATA